MKILAFVLSCVVWAEVVWAAAPTRTYTYTTGDIIDPGKVTTNENNIYDYLQDGVDTLAADAVTAAAIAADAVGSSEIAAGAVGTSEATGLDISDDTNLAAGRNLTLSGDSVETDAELYTEAKCINIPANNAETNWFMYRAPVAMTITGVDCIVEAGTSVVLTPQECDGNGANCSNIEAAITCATTNTTESSGVDNNSIDAGDTIRVTRGTVTGTLDQAFLCLEYTLND